MLHLFNHGKSFRGRMLAFGKFFDVFIHYTSLTWVEVLQCDGSFYDIFIGLAAFLDTFYRLFGCSVITSLVSSFDSFLTLFLSDKTCLSYNHKTFQCNEFIQLMETTTTTTNSPKKKLCTNLKYYGRVYICTQVSKKSYKVCSYQVDRQHTNPKHLLNLTMKSYRIVAFASFNSKKQRQGINKYNPFSKLSFFWVVSVMLCFARGEDKKSPSCLSSFCDILSSRLVVRTKKCNIIPL